MDISNLVVAHYLDGRILCGVTRDFSANRPGLHIEGDGPEDTQEVRLRHLKALFFVRTLEGDPARPDIRGFLQAPAETAQGRKLAVRFRDGEFVCGYTLSWSPDRDGFFLFPADPGSNNQRVYVVAANADEIKSGPAAERLAERVLATEPRGAQAPPAASPSAPAPRVPGMPAHAGAPWPSTHPRSLPRLPGALPGVPERRPLPRPGVADPSKRGGVYEGGPIPPLMPRPGALRPRGPGGQPG